MSCFRAFQIIAAIVITLSGRSLFAQTIGDYRSNANTFNWDNDASWQRWNGANWVAVGANGYPGETPVLPNTTVTIIANDDVTLNVSVSIVNLTIESGTFLNPTTLNTSGNPTLTISGSLTQGNPGGSALRSIFTFGGTGNLAISGNAIITGTTVLASTFTFSSSGLMSVGVNLSISREIDFTISSGSLTVGGSITTQGIGNTTDVTFSTAGNITVSGNTTILTNSSITDSNNTGVSIFTGMVSNSGTWTSTGVTTPAGMIFRGGITDTAPGIFSAGAGTFDLNDQTLAGDGNISFLQAVNITGITLENTNTGSFSVAGTTTLSTSGGFTDSNNSGLTIFAGNLSVGAGTTFVSTAVTTNANMIFRGGIANANSFTAGGATFDTNNQSITGASSLSFANNVAITGVTVNNSNTANLTITGTTTLATSGGFTDSNNTGITIFGGNVNVGASTSFISTAVNNVARMIFRGGIANAGTFTAGAATFNTNNQSITGGSSLSFANNVAITAVTVNNSNTANLTITGTTTLATSGGFTDSNNTGITILVGNVSVGAGTSFITTAVTTTANLVFRGGIANSGTAFTAGGATFNTNNQSITGASSLSFGNNVAITAVTVNNSNTANLTITGTTTLATSGGFTDSNNTGITTLVGNVNVGASTSFITTAVTNTARLVFRGGIANAATGTFSAGGATFNTNNQSLTGAGALSFANNVLITGITVTNSNTGAFTITGTTTLTNGGFTDDNNTSVTLFVGNVSQTGTSAFNTTAVTTNPNMTFRGGITNNGGTFTAGAGTFTTNNQSLAGNSNISFANFVDVQGVTVTNNNTLSVSLTRVPGAATLGGTGTWTQGANSTLNYTGTSIAVSTFNASGAGNTVNYNSTTSVQTIRVPTTTYSNLTFNNTSGTAPQFITAGNTTITGALTFTQGVVSTSLATLLILSDNATSNGGDADSYVDGPIRKIGNDAFIFPTGDGAIWARIGISAPANGTTEFTAQYFDGDFGDITHDGSLNDPSDNEYWTLDRAVTADGVRVTLYWEDNVRSQIDDAVTGDLVVARYNGADWTSEGQFSISSAGATGSVTSNVMTSFSPITFGSLGVGANPLPIELVDFSAHVINSEIELNWITASELNNDFFTVERSSGGEEFSSIGLVNGRGTTSQRNTYTHIDSFPLNGRVYYRLKQTDFDGTFTYSNIISVTYDGSTSAVLQVYPNPSNGTEITFELTGLGETEVIPVVVYDHLGKEHSRFQLKTGNITGYIQQSLTLKEPLPKGVYIIKAGQTPYLTRRLVVTK
jgi:hypothetical protein